MSVVAAWRFGVYHLRHVYHVGFHVVETRVIADYHNYIQTSNVSNYG